MREFNVIFEIRKGLGPDTFLKTISIGLDDLDPEMSENEINQTAIFQAEQQLYQTEDYRVYGKNWRYADIENT